MKSSTFEPGLMISGTVINEGGTVINEGGCHCNKVIFHRKSENVELSVVSFIKNRKIQILKNLPVEMWSHGSNMLSPPIKLKTLKVLCLLSRTKQGIKKAMTKKLT